MKSHTEYLMFNLPAKMAFENITPQVEEIVKKSGGAEGLLLCNAMHITASVFLSMTTSQEPARRLPEVAGGPGPVQPFTPGLPAQPQG